MKKLIKKSQQFYTEIQNSSYIMRDLNQPYVYVVTEFFPNKIPTTSDWGRYKKFNIPVHYRITTYVGSEEVTWTKWVINKKEYQTTDLNTLLNQMKTQLLTDSQRSDVINKYISNVAKTVKRVEK